MKGTGRTSHNLQEIVPAAYHGRVEHLFVATDRQEWGIYDSEQDELQYLSQSQPGAEDLLDAAAIQTMMNGGTVFTMEPAAVPDGSLAAAVFRY
jgi:hypothetical protein